MSTLKVDNIQTSAAGLMPVIKDSSGVEVMQGSTARGSFNGAGATIYSQFNISAITRSSAGLYTLTFATQMTNTNYTVICTVNNKHASGVNNARVLYAYNRTLTDVAIELAYVNGTGNAVDYDLNLSDFSVAIFGGK